ncbi:unnamed protein product [Owenia fusiformis]|uniref:C-type lectin domain-containing protein n=1 Tax=Owenia fusiformis TaxID=6347 RepID=A0A8S4Q5Z1_OWEFU|nr:unnamed protein product [Owenia fusiformis]
MYCESEWDLYDGHCYRKFSSELDFADARLSCQSFGADLVVITTSAENAYVIDTYVPNPFVSLGIGVQIVAGNFTYTDAFDTPVSYTDWNSGEPDGSGMCVRIYLNKWRDSACSPRPYLCERNQWDDSTTTIPNITTSTPTAQSTTTELQFNTISQTTSPIPRTTTASPLTTETTMTTAASPLTTATTTSQPSLTTMTTGQPLSTATISTTTTQSIPTRPPINATALTLSAATTNVTSLLPNAVHLITTEWKPKTQLDRVNPTFTPEEAKYAEILGASGIFVILGVVIAVVVMDINTLKLNGHLMIRNIRRFKRAIKRKNQTRRNDNPRRPSSARMVENDDMQLQNV